MKKIEPKYIAMAVVSIFALAGIFAVIGVWKMDLQSFAPKKDARKFTENIKKFLPPIKKVTPRDAYVDQDPSGSLRDPLHVAMEARELELRNLRLPSEGLLENLSEQTQKTLRSRYNLGLLKYSQSDTMGAVRAFESIFEINPVGRYGRLAYIQVGVIYDQSSQPDSAIFYLKNAVSLDASDPIAAHDLGLAYLHAGNVRQAVQNLRTATNIDPNNAGILQNLGNAYMAENNLTTARETYKSALALDPRRGSVRFNLGMTQYKLKNYDDAQLSFKQAASDLSGSALYRDLAFLGMTQFRLGLLPEAAASFKRAADGDPGQANYRFDEAVVYGLLQQQRQASIAYQDVLSKSPSDTNAWFGYAGVEYMAGNQRAALNAYLRGLSIDSLATGPLFTVGYILFEQGDLSGASTTFKRVIEIGGPDAPRAHVNLGLCYEAKGLLEDAAREYTMGDLRDPRTFYNLGLVRRKLGQIELAIKAFSDAVTRAEKVRPNETRYSIALADAYLSSGRPQAAIASYKKAVSIGGDDFEIMIRLARLTTKREKLSDAEEWVNRSLNTAQTGSQRALAYLVQGLLFEKRGLMEDALHSLNEALTADKTNADIYYNLGVLYARQLRYDDAVKVLRVAVRIDPDHAAAWTQLGNIFYTRGIKDQAVKAYTQAVRIDSSAIEAAFNLKMMTMPR